MEKLVGCAPCPQFLLDDGDQAVGGDCRPDLDAHGIFGTAPEFLDLQMLLQPFEEQFDLPAVSVEVRDFQRLDPHGVGDERKIPVLLLVVEPDQAQLSRILPPGDGPRQPDLRIGLDVLRQSSFPFQSLELEVLPRSDHPPGRGHQPGAAASGGAAGGAGDALPRPHGTRNQGRRAQNPQGAGRE